MIEETAIVVECQGEYAWVEAQRKTACGQCQVKKGCGTSVLAQVVGKKATRMRVLNRVAARVGDSVIIGLHESAMLTGSLVVYMLPLLSMLLLAITGKLLAEQLLIPQVELVTVIFALAGLWLAGLGVRRFSRRIQLDERYQPVVLRRLTAGVAMTAELK